MQARPTRSASVRTAAVGALLASTLLAAVLLCARPALAQDYSFSVPEMKMLVTAQQDGSVRIVYDITFHNNPGAHVIDVVDIGTPDKRYDLKDIRASVGDWNLSDFRHSTYIDCGFEVHLGGAAIAPGDSGTLHVEFEMPERIYQDTTRSDYASLRITPTWFDPQCLRGKTHLQVAVQLPQSVQPEEVLHQRLNFTSKARTDRGALVGWDFGRVRVDGPHMVALSFPKRDLKHVVVKTRWQMLREWFAGSTPARLLTAAGFLGLFGFLFFRFSAGTGISVFVIFSAVAVLLFILSPGLQLLSLPLVVVAIGVNEWCLARRRAHYMPPIAQVEGGGIKRGLTAPEAAALLELPLSKVLGLVIFGMLKKGILRQVDADPLVVEPTEDFRMPDEAKASEKQRGKFYRRAGQRRGIVVHQYEYPFIFLLQSNPAKPVSAINFGVLLRLLMERVVRRMRGFDLSDTRAYYRSIVRRAVEQAAAVGDVAQREKAIDRDFEWILMDDDYPTVFTRGRPYVPIWCRGAAMAGGQPGGSVPAPSAPAGRTTFGDVSASFAGWAENTMGSLASAIAPGSLGVTQPSGGLLNLSGADRVTGEFFQALAEAAQSSGSGGGGGGGCACACAGCACACACAGGGR